MKTEIEARAGRPARNNHGLIPRLLYWAVLTAGFAPALSRAQTDYTFATFAGSGGESSSKDGTGTAASFLNPNGVAMDGSGNVYVADTGNQTIRKITPAGVVTTLAGSVGAIGSTDGIGSAARFYYPRGIAVDTAGELFVADSGNLTIRKITPAGAVTTMAGSAGVYGSTDGIGSAASFSTPYAIAVDGSGNVFVAETYTHVIRKITPGGVVTTLAGSAGEIGNTDGSGSNARFGLPYGIAAGSSGNIYVADGYGPTIRKISPDRSVTTLAGVAGYGGSTDGTGTAARFAIPYGVAVDAAENVFVSDNSADTVRKITPAGVVTTLAGVAGRGGFTDGTGTAARFNQPTGLACDGGGNLVIADAMNQMIRRITLSGMVTTVAGSAGCPGNTDGPTAAAKFNNPQGLAIDGAGNVYVADTDNTMVREISPARTVATVLPVPYVMGPYGVAVDGAGNLYATDGYSQIARQTPAGVSSTFAGNFYQGSADGTGSGRGRSRCGRAGRRAAARGARRRGGRAASPASGARPRRRAPARG